MDLHHFFSPPPPKKRHYKVVFIHKALFPSAIFDILTWKASDGTHTQTLHLLMDIGHVQFSKSLNAVSFGDRKRTEYSGRTQMTRTDDADHREEDFFLYHFSNVEVRI